METGPWFEECLCVFCAQCLQHLDVSVLVDLVPRLCDLLKSGVGLGTKVGNMSRIPGS